MICLAHHNPTPTNCKSLPVWGKLGVVYVCTCGVDRPYVCVADREVSIRWIDADIIVRQQHSVRRFVACTDTSGRFLLWRAA